MTLFYDKKYYHQYDMKYEYDDYNIFHILADLRYKYVDINDMIQILNFYSENLNIDMKKKDENNLTPLGYIIKNKKAEGEIYN